MPHVTFNIQRRDGLFSIIKVARQMCKLIVAFTPVIIRLYPSNTALHDALTAASTACQTLEELASAQRDPGV